jgi:hypothetical protein
MKLLVLIHMTGAIGYLYTSSGTADHVPYYVADSNGENTLLNLPFHYAIDDAMFFNFGWVESGPNGQRLADPESVLDIWWAAFQHLYEQGSYLNICLHPFISGRALRTAMFDRFITKMQSLPGVWFPTCEELARYCLEHFPPPPGSWRGALHDALERRVHHLGREKFG